MKTNVIKLKPYSLAELARQYEVCVRTMQKWMQPFEKDIGIKQGRYFTISQVKIIFEKLGLPASIE
jgi:transposase-like protein